jgi:hypothetical protein
MSLTKPERETIVTMNDEDGSALIWTAQRPIITRLKRIGAELLEEGDFEGTPWASFSLPRRNVSFKAGRNQATVRRSKPRTAQPR